MLDELRYSAGIGHQYNGYYYGNRGFPYQPGPYRASNDSMTDVIAGLNSIGDQVSTGHQLYHHEVARPSTNWFEAAGELSTSGTNYYCPNYDKDRHSYS